MVQVDMTKVAIKNFAKLTKKCLCEKDLKINELFSAVIEKLAIHLFKKGK